MLCKVFYKVFAVSMIFMFALCGISLSQQDPYARPYTPGVDADIDMYFGNWMESMPIQTHGSLVERAMLTKGDPLKPPRKGAVLKYVNRYSYASLSAYDTTKPTILKEEQEIFYIISGKGVIKAGKEKSELQNGSSILIPSDLEFTITNTGDEPLTMFLINEPTPLGFIPNKKMFVNDAHTTPILSTNGHWCHIVKMLVDRKDGLGTLSYVLTISLDSMTLAHPHPHIDGCEEVYAGLEGTSVAFLGKQLRMLSPGTAYMIPPDGKTPHSNINVTDKRITMFYFVYHGELDQYKVKFRNAK